MKKVISEVALTVVSPFATLLFMAMFLVYASLCAGFMGIILPLLAWIDQTIDTATLLVYSAVFGSLLAFGKYWNHIPFIEDFEELAWGRGIYVLITLTLGGFLTAGIIVNFF